MPLFPYTLLTESITYRSNYLGSYTCIATNIAGEAQREMTLDVYIPPSIRRGPSLVSVSLTIK